MFENFKIICPVCGRELKDNEKSLICPKGHCFDRARQGYINLLPVQNKHSLSPGDAKDMLLARRAFLERGDYQPLCMDAAEKIQRFCRSDTPVMVDVGCGEGYYTAAIEKTCHACCMGMDIAKEAAKMACARSKSILWTVGTASHIPLADNSADVVLAVFSLFVNDEYARILKKGGIVVEITAGSGHLREMKDIIYEDVFQQDKHPAPCGEQFEICLTEENKFTFDLNNEALRELLAMTPHSRRMKKERMEQIAAIDHLSLTADYIIRVLRNH